MNKIWIFFTSVVLIAACTSTPREFVLTGDLKNCTSSYAIIKTGNNSQFDTIPIAADGTFRYSKLLDASVSSFLMIPEQEAFFMMLLINGTTNHLKVDLSDPGNYQVGGDLEAAYSCWQNVQKTWNEKTSREYASFNDLQVTLYAFRDSVKNIVKGISNEEYRKLQLQEINFFITATLITYRDILSEKKLSLSSDPDYNRYMENFDLNVPEYLGNGYIMYCLDWWGRSRQENGGISYLDMLSVAERKITNSDMRERVFKEILNSYFSEGDDNELEVVYAKGNELLKDSTSKSWLAEKYTVFKMLKPGAKAIDCNWTDVKGNKSKLSDLYGKVIYLDVWATWCGPCCEEIPYMEKLAEHFKNDSRVELVSVSVDSRQKDWLAKLEKDKPQWKQFLCKNFCELYNINGIPRFIMINKEGKIITVNAPRPSDPGIIEFISEKLN